MHRIVFQITIRDSDGNVCNGYSTQYVTLAEEERKVWEDYITKSGARPEGVGKLKKDALEDALESSWNTTLKYKVTPIRIEEDFDAEYPQV